MRQVLKGMILALAPLTAAVAQDAVPPPEPSVAASEMETLFPQTPLPLAEYVWVRRPIVVFADTPNDPRFVQQMEMLRARPEALLSRGVVVLTDTDPTARGPLRESLRPRGFMLVLIGKDGQIKLRKPAPRDVRELSRVIDNTRLRQEELRELQQEGGAG